MSDSTLTAAIRQRAQGATHAVVVGDRPITARWAVVLGLLMGVTMHYTQEMGALMAQPEPRPSLPNVVQLAEQAPQEIPAPNAPYRVDVMDLTDARVITSVHLDSVQWSELEQRAFLRKLVIQADQRGVTQDRALVVHAYAVDGATQMQAMAFLKQAISESGIEPTTPDINLDGNLKTSGRPGGLRFDYDASAQSLDRLGSDPCFVKTGDEIGCIRAEARAEERSTRRGSLGEAATSNGTHTAAPEAEATTLSHRRSRPR